MNGVEFYKSGLFEFVCFLGGGGGALGSHLDRRRIIGACEQDPYRTAQILARQKDQLLPWFLIWDDIRTFGYDNPETRWFVEKLIQIREKLVISGGFPCQDISPAGRGEGIHGKKSGLFFEFARVVSEIKPKFWFMENSTDLTLRGIDAVLLKVAEMGYNARWAELGADNAGAPHERKRIWILAYTKSQRLQENGISRGHETKKSVSPINSKITWWDDDPGEICDTSGQGLQDRQLQTLAGYEENQEFKRPISNKKLRVVKSRLDRMAAGIPDRVDRLKAIGDGQVPSVASIAWRILSEGLI